MRFVTDEDSRNEYKKFLEGHERCNFQQSLEWGEVKTNWKILCDKNHINLKQGITFAMEHLIQEIENDEVMLTIGGVMKKRK